MTMAHFAELDQSNQVLRVIVVNNSVLLNENGQEIEQLGIDFCKTLYGADTNWIQTSYNNSFRRRQARVGGTYDPQLDAFIPPKPADNPSFILDNTLLDWVPPVAYPSDGHGYIWYEPSLSWLRYTSKPVPDTINRYIWNSTINDWEQVTVETTTDGVQFVWDPVAKDFVQQSSNV